MPQTRTMSMGIDVGAGLQSDCESALDEVNLALKNVTERAVTLVGDRTGDDRAFGQAVQQWLIDFGTVQSRLAAVLENCSPDTWPAGSPGSGRR